MTLTQNPFISVIVVNYNSGEMLSKALSALAEQTYANFEVVVIDNHSMDNSWQAAEKTNFPCRLVRLNENTGFAAANNLAVADYIQSDWIFFLNPDAYPEPECLEVIVKNINRIPDVDCFACALIDANKPSHLDGLGDAYHISGLHWRSGHGYPCDITPNQPVEIFSACAAAAIYRTGTYRRLGGFDEAYFAYSEDVDLGFRLRLIGGKSLLLPDAKVHHVGSGITGSSSDFSVYHGHRNLTWTFIKNMPSPLIFILLPVHLAMILYVGFFYAASGRLRLYLQAKIDAFKHIGSLLKERKKIQSQRVCSSLSLLQLMAWLPRRTVIKAPAKLENTTH
ncbi:glycosyltransferase family 2 protein [Nitrosomonas oligotropha]|uniref:glycosyltransferase family 2 protein n=1 Tax=Nitrosomonas oligotropha TaxID=42354 RepID=UPI00136C38A1|nr:glycosyltransferase family 2 protein [Nitrosomonas oligotropha]MXS83192.1 glycosyltransferase family 2 protein [Nitrosomonas oligotropha]